MQISHISFLLFLAIINFTSAAAHGHRHRHSHRSTTNEQSDIEPHTNETTFNLSFVTAERAKVQHIQRHARKFSHLPRDQLRIEKGGSSEDEETKEYAVWMQYTTAILILGLVLGAELVG
jgi:hypothetical protein